MEIEHNDPLSVRILKMFLNIIKPSSLWIILKNLK